MEYYDVPQTQWSNFGPILNPDANLVYMAMDTTDRMNYSTLKPALYAHCCMSKETYREKMKQLLKQPGESWNTCGNWYMNLTLKWMAECTTVKDVVELLAIDAVTKLMPQPIANHVQDHTPATLTDATKLADSFMQTRSWSHDQTGDNEGRSHEENRKSTNHRREDYYRQEQSSKGSTRDGQRSQPMAHHADLPEQKTADYWKQQPKYDGVKGPHCFSCNSFGHYASDCPKKKKAQDMKKAPKLKNISLVMPILPRKETELIKSEVMGRVVTSGKIAG